ncbi:TPA: transposase family protein [Pseudomonas putida]|uniref:transposase n=1 Tax=Pseudomonas putida TaxID=303 RepID=UPI0023646550|nr:transposase [Pseudomonas putida]MDD2010293.1 transposase [Pseudomonas putida]HDS1776879.1 transposase family protein [Pseudomonas putida]
MDAILSMKTGEHYRYHGENYQVVDIRGDRIQLRSFHDSRTVIYQSFAALAVAHKRGDLTKTQEAPFAADGTLISAILTERHKTVASYRLLYIKPILNEFNGRLPRLKVINLVNEIATLINDPHPPSFGSIYRWKKAYLARGEDYLGLVPQSRQRRLHRLENQCSDVQDLIRSAVEELYFTRTPCNKKELIQAIQCSIDAANEKRASHNKLHQPSFSTLYRIICDLDQYEVDLQQLGFHVASKKHKWSKKRRRPYWRYELVEGDTQLLDVVTCDKDGHPIGRAYLTALMEVRTRMIIGWDISYNPPCSQKTLRALKASLNSDNPYGGLACSYRLDNGSDFTGLELKTILGELGAAIIYCEPGNPDQKPHIEIFFKSWTTTIVHCMRGTTFSTPTHYDSEGNAIYTLDEVKAIFQDWLTNVYHANFHTGLGMSPLEAWENDENQRNEFPPRRFSVEDLNRHFLSCTYITPNNGRLRFRGLSWTGGGVTLMAEKCSKKKRRLRVLYDPCDLGTAWVSDPEHPSVMLDVFAVDPDYQNGLTLHLHNLIKASMKSRSEELNYRIAIEHRNRILHSLAVANTKSRRKQREIAKELGDFELANANTPPNKPTLVGRQQHPKIDCPLHPQTPSSYQVMELNHDTSKS